MNRKEVENRLILLALTGSHSYGLALPSSDTDFKGIFIAPREYYLGTRSIEQKDKGWNEPGNGCFTMLDGNKDTVAYELRKYIMLASKCNPNILELLFENPKYYYYVNPLGHQLIQNKELFLSKRVKHTYSGYAFAQIKKVKTHRKWLLDPVKKRPLPHEFGMAEDEVLTKAQLNSFLEFAWMLIRDRIEYLDEAPELYNFLQERIDLKGSLKNSPIPSDCTDYLQKLTRATDDFMVLLVNTQQYRAALKEYNNYQSWLTNRNKDRAALEAKIGYDAKHMAHCIRLLRTGNEILLTGELNVDRTDIDAKQLLEIRQGKVPYDIVTALADSLFEELETSYKHSTLPHSADHKAIEELTINLVEQTI